jgi:crotonobetainyl-CoA hydratase
MITGAEERPLLIERKGHVMVLTLNRPEARNAVNLALTIALGEALEEAEHDRGIWAVVLTGAGDKAFCAGGDMKARARGEPSLPPDDRARWGWAGYTRHPIGKPTIAAVNGSALGGGTELVCASDLAVAADTASFGLAEVRRGVFAGAGGAFRLPRQLPKKIAMEMILTGEPITARRAFELGFVNRVVPQPQVLAESIALAEKICRNAPLAVQASKRVAVGIVDGGIPDEDASWNLNKSELDVVLKSADLLEGARAFVEKREPNWEAA